MNMPAPSTMDDFFKNVAEKSSGAVLRGNYDVANERYEVSQDWERYTPEEHALWRRLYERQAKLIPGRACDEFIEGLARMGASDQIPRFDETSDALFKATGWRLVAVPGLIPDQVFFEHLAHRRFPVTWWLRTPEEFDYIVEPDVFHDFFGHVPLLFNPIFADHMQAYGVGGLKALKLGGLSCLSRLYWYTVEFGLIQTDQGLRVYGAGILSSGGEVVYCLDDKKPRRIAFDVERIMRTLYKIDSYQETYFVIQSFKQLFADTEPDFTSLYAKLETLAALPADTLLPSEINIAPNSD